MIRAAAIAFSALAAAAPAGADVIKIETNDWSLPRPVTWTGRLEAVDAEAELARFVYRNGAETVALSIHVSRIYSLTFDAQDQVRRDFPPTRRPLDEPLPTGPKRRQIIELRNDGFLGDDIPEAVRVRPSREAPVMALRGWIESMDAQGVALRATVGREEAEAFTVARADLRSWIRGR